MLSKQLVAALVAIKKVFANPSVQLIVAPVPVNFIVLVVVGVLLWLVNSYIPMQGTIKSILNAVIVIAVVIWLLKVFGVLGNLQQIHV